MEIFGDLTRFSFAELIALFVVVRMEMTLRKFSENLTSLCEKQENTNNLIIAHLTQAAEKRGIE